MATTQPAAPTLLTRKTQETAPPYPASLSLSLVCLDLLTISNQVLFVRPGQKHKQTLMALRASLCLYPQQTHLHRWAIGGRVHLIDFRFASVLSVSRVQLEQNICRMKRSEQVSL